MRILHYWCREYLSPFVLVSILSSSIYNRHFNSQCCQSYYIDIDIFDLTSTNTHMCQKESKEKKLEVSQARNPLSPVLPPSLITTRKKLLGYKRSIRTSTYICVVTLDPHCSYLVNMHITNFAMIRSLTMLWKDTYS